MNSFNSEICNFSLSLSLSLETINLTIPTCEIFISSKNRSIICSHDSDFHYCNICNESFQIPYYFRFKKKNLRKNFDPLSFFIYLQITLIHRNSENNQDKSSSNGLLIANNSFSRVGNQMETIVPSFSRNGLLLTARDF